MAKSLTPTRGNVLKVCPSFYDPLGFIFPITARIKTIFQLLCKNQCYMKIYPVKLNQFGMTFWQSEAVCICATQGNLINFITWFCGSSCQVYYGMVYIQVETTLGIRVSFLCAKPKVLKDVLAVALNGRVSLDSVYCLGDSGVALWWVKGTEKCWKPLVENRVVSIRNIMGKDTYYHISGVINPADIPTRDFKVNDFDRWFDGPQCLYTDIDVSKFDVGERLKLVEVVVQNESKGGKKDVKGVNSVNLLYFA